MSANSECDLRTGKAPTSCCWSHLKSCPTTFDSRAFKVSQSTPCAHICFYARAAPKGDCFHSLSFTSCSPSLRSRESAWIPPLIPTPATSRFLTQPNTDGGEGAWSHQRSRLTCNRCLWVSERRRCLWEPTLALWEWPRAAGSAESWWFELATALLLVSALEGW